MADCVFGICDGSGLVVDEEARTVRPCRCRSQVLARGRARTLSAVIPSRYREVGFDRPPVADMPAPVVRAVRAFTGELDANLEAGRGLWFMGDVGTGKTTLAMLVSRLALDAGRSVAIYSLPRLINLIRRSYDPDSPWTDAELIDRLVRVDLLQLDDVGAEKTSDWVLEQVYSIVNGRYEAERSIVLTTNLDNREELAQQIGERTVSRLMEMCSEIPVYGPDHRELAV